MGNTRPHAGTQGARAEALARSPKTFLDRDNWIRAVLASDLPDPVVRMAIAIGMHLRVNTGQCDPSYAALAAESRIAERSAYRLVALLKHTGWLAILSTRGRHSNQYALLNPAKALSGLDCNEPCQSSVRVGPAEPCQSSVRVNPANKVADKKRSKRAKKEREKSKTRAPGFLGGEEADARRTKAKQAQSAPPAIDLATFERFWAAYPRQIAKEAARKAFEAAVENGDDPEAIIAGAARFAIERADEEPKYTPYPQRWLKEKRWQDPPPDGAVIDENGNVVAIEQPQPQGRDRGIVALAEELAREIEANGGGW